MKIFNLAATLVAAGFITTATPAAAQSVSTSVHVSYADLNLSSSTGQKTLERRIDAAAKIACDIDPNERDLNAVLTSSRCLNTAVSGARASLAAATALELASR